MARHLRVEFSGAIYHVTCRMVGDWRTEKTLLFKDDADHERFLDRLAERVVQFNIRVPSASVCSPCFLVFGRVSGPGPARCVKERSRGRTGGVPGGRAD